MKRILLLLIATTVILTACQTVQEPLPPIDNTDIPLTTEIVNTTAPTLELDNTLQPSATPVLLEDSQEEEIEKDIEEESTKSITPSTSPKPTATVSSTPKPTEKPTAVPEETPKQTSPPTQEPTSEPTQTPSYTVISGSIRSGALEGVNEGRVEEGNELAKLDSNLNAKAEAHAIAMAKADNLYHSSMGYVESVRRGANIGGWAEGYGASCHATQLATDANITKIGVGSAKSADGTVYTCIIGN